MNDRIGDAKTTVISSPSHSVRVMIQDGEAMFAARDVLSACGIKYPDKWIRRNEGRFEVKKLGYPLETGSGMRRVKMLFVSGDCGKRIVANTACPKETRRWLQTEVLTYEAKVAVQDDVPAKPKEGARSIEAIGKMVDSALIGLLEIKKYIAEIGAAG